jgi:hypothetical protein
MTDLVKRLRSYTTDWDGAKMVPGEPPIDGLRCEIIDAAADRIEQLERELAERTKAHDCDAQIAADMITGLIARANAAETALAAAREKLAQALPILQAYAERNPKHNGQDPRGVHALLATIAGDTSWVTSVLTVVSDAAAWMAVSAVAASPPPHREMCCPVICA